MGVKLVKEEQSVKVLYANVPGLIILMIGCVALMAWSIYQATDDSRFSKICKRTEGAVVDYEMYYDEDDDERYVGIYEYAVDGVVYKVEEDDWHLSAPELGESAYVYYNPGDPADARLSVGGVDAVVDAMGYSTICVVGGIFFFIALAMLLAHYKVSMPWIQLLVGSAFTLLGIGIPILTMGAGCPLIIWGLIGVYLVIKGYLGIRGKKEETQVFEEQVGAVVGGVVKGLAGIGNKDVQDGDGNEITVEDVQLAAENVEKAANSINTIVVGISCAMTGFVFLIAGIVQIIIMPDFGKILGVIFAVAGLAAMILGVWFIVKTFRNR